jgi:hypothetical protein
MPNRSRDWLSQAQRDLEQAEDSLRAGRHEWACFAAQQAGEKAVKAPNSHPEGAPFEHYGPLQGEEAIGYAGQILELVRARMA